MIRVVVADDEAPARRKVARELAAHPDVALIAECANGREAVKAIRAGKPDLVFLDLQMPLLSGIGVVEEIGPGEMPVVVFVTAHDAHAVRAFEVEALDYLLKPFSPERFARVLERARERIGRSSELAGPLGRASDALEPQRPLRRLLVEERGRAFFLPIDEVERLRADGNYVRLVARGKEHLIRATLSSLEARLDRAKFLRLNRSDIVRFDCVGELVPGSHGDWRVVLRDGTTLTWSRRFRAQRGGEFDPA